MLADLRGPKFEHQRYQNARCHCVRGLAHQVYPNANSHRRSTRRAALFTFDTGAAGAAVTVYFAGYNSTGAEQRR